MLLRSSIMPTGTGTNVDTLVPWGRMTSVATVAGRSKVVAQANEVAVAMDVAVTAADADEIMNVVHMRTT